MPFKSTKIKDDEETVAERLRATREEKKISLAAAAKSLAINREYLAALENGTYADLPSGVYLKTFLREYSSFLGLDAARIVAKFQKEEGGVLENNKDVFSKKKIDRLELLIFPKFVKNTLLLLVAVIFFSYLGYYLLNTFSPPQVEIFQPADNLVTTSTYVDVTGHADAKTQIAINDKQILKDGAGNFQERIDLNKGINIIIISAQNKYSQKKLIEKQILVK